MLPVAGLVEVLAGAREIFLQAGGDLSGRARRRVLRALRPYGASRARRFPAPRLPAPVAREVRRTARAEHRLHDMAAVAARLGVPAAQVRGRLRVVRALARLGGARGVACQA